MALISKASLLMVPSTYEQEKLYNVLPSGNRAPDSTDQNSGYDQTRADFSFDRGSNAAATRIGSDGLIKKYRENLLVQSNQFDVSVNWVNTSSSETSGHTGYDGSSDAWLITKSGSGGRLHQNITASGVLTYSVYLKANASTWGLIQMNGSGADKYVYINLSTGAKGAVGGGNITEKIEDVGNGWYRVSVTASTNATRVRIYPAEENTASGTSGSIYFQNAQLESSMVATDYLDSGATTAKAGVLIDLPRINYDANGENGALLLEPQRKNVVTSTEYVSSNDYVVGNWTGTITTNTTETLSPEGVYNATKFVKAGASDRVYFHNSQPDGAYTGSIYLKAASGSENKTIEISVRRFGGGGGSTSKLVTITNEWQRFDVTATNLTGGTTTAMYIADFSMDGTATDFYSYGMQIEAGSYATSYIPNMGESGGVTRAADTMSTTPTDLLGSTTGSWFMELNDMTFEIAGTSVPTIYLGDDTQNCLALEARNSGNNKTIYLVKEESGAVTTLHAFTISGTTKFCFVWNGTTLKVFRDGAERYSSTSFTQPTNWDLFVFNSTSREAFSEIANIQLYDTALSDSEAETLTTL